ncbi:hypothetical protein GYA37_00705 [candidate division WWE3 bacterium]|uniref:Uracil-DNA glycosylase-like domain-containing protein n=1 Tax=candidate division WWE3 bacterium TaxID=2053526 RepID=A0A7X9E6D8_UNCKA|nr:hypothetical protein [candidate division WWE3 bacterium]
MDEQEHYCENTDTYPITKFFKLGNTRGKHILLVGESPAPNGWRKSGKAFYTINGKLLPTGKNLNKLFEPYQLNIDDCSFTELVKCYVDKKRKQLDVCGSKCWPIFLKQLKANNIRFIILLGVKTLEIFNKNSNLNLEIGVITEASLSESMYQFLPIYHPSPIGPYNHQKNIEIFNKLAKQLRDLLC